MNIKVYSTVLNLFWLILLVSGVARADVLSTTYYHSDALGSPVAATDENGAIKWREQYRPYGERMLEEAEALDNARWYTGHPQDEETGLVYAGARYYDPVVGRFYAIDPVGFTGEIDTFNRYSYAANNPYKYIDPDGQAKVYVETQGTGHVGITTNYNGNEVNYDFGRYKGKYSNSIYSGPGILMRTGGTPRSANYKGYKVFDLSVSQALDNEIAKSFRAAFDKGSASFPEEIMKRLNKPSQLSSSQRYSGSDWGLTGPNCVSHTFDTLKSALQEVMNPESRFSESLRREATSLYNKIERMDTYVFTPRGAKDALNENFKR